MSENRDLETTSSQAAQGCVAGSTHRARSPERTAKPHDTTASKKKCSKCGKEKELSEFERNRGKLRGTCKRCRQDQQNARYASRPDVRARRLQSHSAWRERNPELKRALDKQRYERDRAAILAQKRKYHLGKYESVIKPYKDKYNADPAVIERKRLYSASYHKLYYAAHKSEYLARFLARRIARDRAVPKWANLRKIAGIYRAAKVLSEATGERYEVDHIVPLKGKNVCGLHCESNLRIVKRYENRKKHNRLLEDIC